jgi:hypothetical protein
MLNIHVVNHRQQLLEQANNKENLSIIAMCDLECDIQYVRMNDRQIPIKRHST